MNALKVRIPFVTVLDDGLELTTSASLNISTGELTDFEKFDPINTAQMSKREYIILNDEQLDVISEEDDVYWVMLNNNHPGLC